MTYAEVLSHFDSQAKEDFKIYTAGDLGVDDQDFVQAMKLSQQEAAAALPVLGGRVSLIHGELPSFGKVVLKSYRRGGAFRKILPSVSLKFQPSRAVNEMYALLEVRKHGILTPRPLFALTHGEYIRKEWLVMEELPSHLSLAQISLEAPELLEQYMPEATRQIEMLIQHGILHVDLHPGNVLVVEGLGVTIIDFDHAKKVDLPMNDIRDKYVRRWRRAVIKHNLPDDLSELLCAGLRINYQG